MSDISSDTAIASGSSTARALSSRFSDEYSVEDFGVVDDPNGVHVTSNTAAYIAALTAAANVARLRHPAGLTVFIDTPLVFAANTVLQLDGLLKLAVVSSWTSGDCMISVASNSIIEGIGIIDGNAANQIVSSVIGGIGPSSAPGPTNFVAQGITVQNTKNWPFNVNGAMNCYVINCSFITGGSSVEFADNCTNCWFINCVVENISDLGVGIYGTAQNCGIVGCSVTACSSCGPFAYSDASQPGVPTNILISGNFVTACGSGIIVYVGAGGTPPQNISVCNNRCISNLGTGIVIQQGTGIIVSENFCSENNTNATTTAPPEIEIGQDTGSNTGCFVTNNIILNPGKNGGSGTGIYLYQPSSCFITGNFIADLRSSRSMLYGLSGSTGNYVYTESNYIYGATNVADNIAYSSSSTQGQNFFCGPGIANGSVTGFPQFTKNLVNGGLSLQHQGLSFGWNLSGTGDCSILCAGGTAAGSWNGLNFYGVDDTGKFVSGPIHSPYPGPPGAFAEISPTGAIKAGAGFQQGGSGPTWTSGAGTPTSTQPVGSLYSNTSGGLGSRLYVSAGGGTWNAIAGV